MKNDKKKKKIFKYSMAFILVFVIAFLGAFAGYKFAIGSSGGTSTSTMKITKTSADNSSTGDYTKIIADCQKSVVQIETESVQSGSFFNDYVSEGAGSGVVISSDGYIVTNYHVIEGANKISVTVEDENKTYTASVVGYDSNADIAVIKIDDSNMTSAAIGDSDKLETGDDVFAIGNPLGELGDTVTEGIISSPSRDLTLDGTKMTLLQTTAAINPGNSGGGLFNTSGELIGIVNAKSSGTEVEGLGFAIPVNNAITTAKNIVKNGTNNDSTTTSTSNSSNSSSDSSSSTDSTGNYTIGVTIVSVSNDTMEKEYNVSEKGIYVTEVTKGSKAESAGFKSGDMIVSINGKEYSDISDLISKIRSSVSGDKLEFVVKRDSKKVTLTINVE